MRACLLSAVALAGAALVGAAGAAAPSAPPAFVWPLACKVGTSCVIQHYIDHDPSPAARDYACGSLTYDGHDGIDIRLPDMAAQRAGVAVLAAADGKVLRLRDGVADVSVAESGQAAVKDIECGNGMVIDHGGGFEAQYCHMAKGSLVVKPGDMVQAGQPIGKVGLSGDTEFPHLHFTLREAGKVVDPFAYGAAEGACTSGRSLWRDTPAYQARVVLNAGFTTGPVTMAALEAGGLPAASADAGILVAYVRAVGLKAGDVQTLELRAPGGSSALKSASQPLPRNQDQSMVFGGRRRPAPGWARGRYQAIYTVNNGDRVVLTRTFTLTL